MSPEHSNQTNNDDFHYDSLEALLSIISGYQHPFTDIMIEENLPVCVLMPSGWEKLKFLPPKREQIEEFFSSLDVNWHDRIIREGAISRPLVVMDSNNYRWRLRINGFLVNSGQNLKIVIRRSASDAPRLEDTGLPASVRLITHATRGLVLISGSTGSGKSTSMAALIEEINRTRKSHIITIEDPIEYIFKNNLSIFSQREVGVDVLSFSIGVKNALRQRPNVIVIGEILDRATAETALIAGESGHLVIGTIHANNAVSTIQKLMSFFDGNEVESKQRSIQQSLVAVISQVLIPNSENTGFELASEVLMNQEGQYKKILLDPTALTSALEQREHKTSQSLGFSLGELIKKGAIKQADAYKVSGLTTEGFAKIRGG